MRFWQLVSIFREQPLVLEHVFQEAQDTPYLEWLKHFTQHVNLQNRLVLDAELPEDITLIAMNHLEHRFQIRNGFLYQCINDCKDSRSSLDIYKLYGGDAIDEVLENGSFQIHNSLANTTKENGE